MRRLLLHSVNIISMRPIKSNDIFFYGYGYIKTPSKILNAIEKLLTPESLESKR